MKKFAISLIALAAISTASFAGSAGDGVDTDSPAMFGDQVLLGQHKSAAVVTSDNAFIVPAAADERPIENYINRSQLR